ncbi:hypothetical protein BHE74_00031330 [Ensete ventricosum]|nr:hypothetical protein BHE74_00031330 [Ensete ventricosum]
MTVEERKGNADQFPVGMRVLAVDDDPLCLKLLEALLRRCQYNVTTTDKAITALNLLRENKDKFDLVISDVHMPDMDGFKLLELVGLEMDLPVISESQKFFFTLSVSMRTNPFCRLKPKLSPFVKSALE